MTAYPGKAYYNEFDREKAAWLRELIREGHIADGEVDERSIKEVKPGDLHGFQQCHWFAGISIWSYALRSAGWPDSREIWTASLPCQPFSNAGKLAGFDDERHLWPVFYSLVRGLQPPVIFGEQVSSKAGLVWFDRVHSDLQSINYSTFGFDLSAAAFGAPHLRQRLYWVAELND